MVDAPIHIWGVGTWRTLRVHWALHELDRSYEVFPIGSRTGETTSKAFTALNPRQKIPMLRHGDRVLGESLAIISYLDGLAGPKRGSLVPHDAWDHARWQEWCSFTMMELDATSLYVLRRHFSLPEIYGDAPLAVQAARDYFTKQLIHLELALADGRPYLLGERLSSADILVETCLEWAVDYGLDLPDVLLDYAAGLRQRSAYVSAQRVNDTAQYSHFGELGLERHEFVVGSCR